MTPDAIDACLAWHGGYVGLRFQLDDVLVTHHGIDLDDFALLHRLADARGEPVSLATLAAALGASRSALLRRLRPLEKTGLVSGAGAAAGYRVALRPAGLRLLRVAGENVVDRWTRAAAQSAPLTAPTGLPGAGAA